MLNKRAAALYLDARRQNSGGREAAANGNGASDTAAKHEILYRACRAAVDTTIQAIIEVRPVRTATAPSECAADQPNGALAR